MLDSRSRLPLGRDRGLIGFDVLTVPWLRRGGTWTSPRSPAFSGAWSTAGERNCHAPERLNSTHRGPELNGTIATCFFQGLEVG